MSAHYEFSTARTATGALALTITPVLAGGRRERPHLYVLLPDEVRGLIGCLDILPDGDE